MVGGPFFELFSWTFLQGNPANALADPSSIVLTKSAAERFFGKEDPMQQALTLNNEKELTVTGVLQDPPANSTILRYSTGLTLAALKVCRLTVNQAINKAAAAAPYQEKNQATGGNGDRDQEDDRVGQATCPVQDEQDCREGDQFHGFQA